MQVTTIGLDIAKNVFLRTAAFWKMTPISIESPAMSAEALYAVLAMPSASARNRNQQTIVSFSVR